MAELRWLDGYAGQTVGELLALEGTYRIDSLVVAFEMALDQKAAREGDASLTDEERVVLAVEALEREVNNGGYDQFFRNSSREYAPVIVDSLRRIGCPKTADITHRSIKALDLDEVTNEAVEWAIEFDDPDRDRVLGECDEDYYGAGEDIAARLFAFIGASRERFRL